MQRSSIKLFRSMLWSSALSLIVVGEAIGQTPSDEGANPPPQLAPHIATILRLIPAEAPVAIIVPNLKTASDELTRLTEGMDRANLLLGLRPLDHLKSATGFNTGIDDLGAAAEIALPPDEGRVRRILIIPVTEANVFISGNFRGEKDGGHVRGDGTPWHVKDLGSHVAVSGSKEVMALLKDGNGLEPLVREHSPALGINQINAADAMVVVNPQMVSEETIADLPITDQQRKQILQNLRSTHLAVMSFDFDPLAVVMRSFATFKDDTDLGTMMKGGEGRGATINALPDKPYYLAGAVDVRGMGGPAVFLGLLEQIVQQPVPNAEKIASFDQIQLAAYPSPAGLAGGLLNDAALIIESSPPTAAANAVKALVHEAPNFADGVKREVKWEDAREVKDVGTAAAYEIKNVDVPPALAQQQMIAGMIYGRTGLRGFVKPTATGAIVTFSQRPAVLKAVVEASAGGADGGLQGNGVLRSMLEWMPAPSDAIGFVDIGQLLKFGLAIADNFGMRDAIALPPLDDSLPPIGFSMEVADGAVTGTTIIPAGVMAVLVDLGFRTAMPMAAPIEPAQPEAGHR